MTLLTFGVGSKVVLVAHDGPGSRAFCFWPGTRVLFEGVVGKRLPKDWATWNVLPTWRVSHEGDVAERRWAEVSS